MGIEEQREEREVLGSIFPDEITDVSETEYRIAIKLDVTNDDEDDSEPPTLVLQVQYPPDYPDKAPHLDLHAPPNAPKHKYLNIQDDKSNLLDSLTDTIEENMGMAMVFTLVSTLKDGAELLVSERQHAAQAMRDFEAAKAEEEENKKFHGTAVTRKSFLEWRDRFKREMAEEEQRKMEEKETEDKKKRVKEEKRMTGREIWEKGLAGKVEEDDEDTDGLLEGTAKVKIEA